ncbi:PREDICTED: multifunctional methyltransferase subunit TRM112-like protein [Ceratosolen solmsi marchali]|uniref:Multifunctional methyltransferase subunit TRM112-like protein n=1 Tax=Ceratosolen solmsi marchali TaxID=326594 RepID=A0AAJ6YL49_9HYME|nr:PREDICTED: multifunctional methyltransferase subunit TRM112-like protein [Ceratosolen solmsi marchali]
MKLLTHNMLTSKCLKGVLVGYPLKIEVQDLRICEVNCNLDFLIRVIPRIDYPVLYTAMETLGYANDLPSEKPEDYQTNEEFLKKLHHALFEIEIINGNLLCPETGRKFPINDGIPNMLLNEDET